MFFIKLIFPVLEISSQRDKANLGENKLLQHATMKWFFFSVQPKYLIEAKKFKKVSYHS